MLATTQLASAHMLFISLCLSLFVAALNLGIKIRKKRTGSRKM